MASPELKERVFAPGNLVHGTELRRLPKLIDKGIEIGWRHKSESYTAHAVCLALLSTVPLPERYNSAAHEGPYSHIKSCIPSEVSILVARAQLLERFPSDLKAVGQLFWDESCGSSHRTEMLELLYGYNSEDNTVFQIPIEKPTSRYLYPDEVRLGLDIRSKANIDPEVWEGLIVYPETLELALKAISMAQRKIHLPIFSPEAELLTVSNAV